MLGNEPHSARDAEIRTVIEKPRHAIQQLQEHLHEGRRIARWYWVASGRIDFLAIETARRRPDGEGITFVVRQLQQKHLPPANGRGARSKTHRR